MTCAARTVPSEGVERHGGAPGPGHGEHGPDEVRAARQPDRHDRGGVPGRRGRGERGGKPAGALVQLRVGHGGVAVQHGGPAGVGGRLLGEPVVDGDVRDRAPRAVPQLSGTSSPSAGSRERRESGSAGAVCGGREQVLEDLEEPVDGAGVEQVGVVLQVAADAFRPVGEVHRQIGERLVGAGLHRDGPHSGQVEAEGFVGLEFREHLEHRGAVGAPGRCQGADHVLEGCPGVVVGVRATARTRSSRVVKPGSPVRSTRRATVLTKKPTSSSARRGRSETGTPMTMSSWPVTRCSIAAHPATRVMKAVARRSRPSRRSRSLSPASSAWKTARPRELITAGRGRSVGSSRTGRSPSSTRSQCARSCRARGPSAASRCSRA